MVNPSKARGTAAESKVVAWLNVNGYPYAERRALTGGKDKGDINASPRLVIEVKDVRTEGGWSAHLIETEVERVNAKADYGILIRRRIGRPDVGDWYACMTVRQLFALLAEAGVK